MASQIPPTTDELRAVFNRLPAMRLKGWTFEKVMAVDYIRWSLERSALAYREKYSIPAQPRLF